MPKPAVQRGQYPIKLEADCSDCHQLCERNSHWGYTRWQRIACCMLHRCSVACCIVACGLLWLLDMPPSRRVRKLTDDCLFGLGPNKYADSRASPLTAWQQILLPLQARASASPRGDFDLLYASCLTFHNRWAGKSPATSPAAPFEKANSNTDGAT